MNGFILILSHDVLIQATSVALLLLFVGLVSGSSSSGICDASQEDGSFAANNGVQTDSVHDVIIIGAGWAGMAAADHLARNAPDVSFLVLESANQTGGRSRARKFGRKVEDGGPGEFVIEEGSNWITGSGGGRAGERDKDGDDSCNEDDEEDDPEYPRVATNKVHDLATQIGAKLFNSSSLGVDIGDVDKVFDEHGHDADPSGRVIDRYFVAVECLLTKCDHAEDDAPIRKSTIREALIGCGWSPQTSVERAVEGTECSGNEFGFEMACEWGSDTTFIWWGNADNMVVDQNPRGYARILDEMVADTVPRDDPRLLLNSHVVNLDYSSEALCTDGHSDGVNVVKVYTRDGRTFHAREIIVTFPLGVLQRFHSSLFSPPLPEDKIHALIHGGAMMRNVTRVALQFPTVWWDNSLEVWAYANNGNTTSIGAEGDFSKWRNMNYAGALPGSNILFCLFGDPQSSYYEAMPDEQVRAAAMRRLRTQHPQIDIPDPTDFFISRHGYDETRYGAISTFRTKWNDESYDVLMRPLADCGRKKRIHFAGEAMCPELTGYTHGALQSGKEVAASYLHDHGLGPDPEETDDLCLCDW